MLTTYLSFVLVVGDHGSDVVLAVQESQQLLRGDGLQRGLDVLCSSLELAPGMMEVNETCVVGR